MISVLQRWVTLGVLALAASLASAAWLQGMQATAALIIVVALTGHAAVLGCEMLLMMKVNRADPTPSTRAGVVLRAWLAEALHGPLVFCWRQPFRSQTIPDCTPAAQSLTSPRGVLLIHGFVCNRGLWNRWLSRLHAQNVPFVAVNLEPPFGSIDQYADTIEHAIRQLEACTGRAPVVVAHSMGGLALRRWWVEPGNDGRVAHAITLGTPHHGTWLARFAVSPNARQMRTNSGWLSTLALGEPPERRRRMTCFFSATDNIVFPASNATLEGADNRLLDDGVAHVAMVDDPRPWQELQTRLSN
jgi:triacylglycerol lipase